MKILHKLVIIFFFGSVLLIRGQDANTVSATIEFSNGDTITITNFSKQIGIQLNEFVNVTLQFPANEIGNPAVVEQLDRGVTSIGSNIPVVGDDGKLSFTFGAPRETGDDVIAIRVGSSVARLQFSVADAARP